jgi:hypothetical protein
VTASAREHAVTELEMWLRQNRLPYARDDGLTWPPNRYADEVNRLARQYARGQGWEEGQPFTDVDEAAVEGALLAGIDAWTRVTGLVPPLIAR